MSSLLQPSRRKKPEINIVPLMDVLTVLIFFLMVTTQFRDMTTMNITPPKIETAGKDKSAEHATVSVNKEGKYSFNSKELSPEALSAAMVELGQKTPNVPVLVIADENTPLHFVTFVIDSSRKAKLEKLRLQSR